MGRDYSYCRASELTDHQVSGFVFTENTEKAKASSETFLRLMPCTDYEGHSMLLMVHWSLISKLGISLWTAYKHPLEIVLN